MTMEAGQGTWNPSVNACMPKKIKINFVSLLIS